MIFVHIKCRANRYHRISKRKQRSKARKENIWERMRELTRLRWLINNFMSLAAVCSRELLSIYTEPKVASLDDEMLHGPILHEPDVLQDPDPKPGRQPGPAHCQWSRQLHLQHTQNIHGLLLGHRQYSAIRSNPLWDLPPAVCCNYRLLLRGHGHYHLNWEGMLVIMYFHILLLHDPELKSDPSNSFCRPKG